MNIVQLPQPGGPSKTIKGRGLFARKLSKAARAVLAAEIAEGTVSLCDLSFKQIASVVGVSVGYAQMAKHLTSGQREDVRRGTRPLVWPKVSPALPSPHERPTEIVGETGPSTTPGLLTTNDKTAA
jgi:hypothetical protein